MKKLGFLVAIMATFLAVNLTKAQSNLDATGKVILVKLDPSTMSEARGKLMNALTEGKLSGYIKAEQSFLVTIADDNTKIQAAKNQILTAYPAAVLSVVSVQQANVLIENQRNANFPANNNTGN